MSTRKPPSNTTLPPRKKLPKLPANATVSKRPLHHPATPSPYAGASQPKIIYVGSSTPFIATVKRVERLLKLSDKRLVQSATTLAKHGGKRKRGGDDILEIASEVERLKGKKRRGAVQVDGEGVESVGEEVTLKGTGRAVGKVMEMGGWFLQRGEVYAVRVKTGSVGAIDDVSIDEGVEVGEDVQGAETGTVTGVDGGGRSDGNVDGVIAGAEKASVDVTAEADDMSMLDTQGKGCVATLDGAAKTTNGSTKKGTELEAIPETRIRYLSVLEVCVSLR